VTNPPFSEGKTVITPRSGFRQPAEAWMFVFNAGVNLNDIVRAVTRSVRPG
jgi:hypothetical protein